MVPRAASTARYFDAHPNVGVALKFIRWPASSCGWFTGQLTCSRRCPVEQDRRRTLGLAVHPASLDGLGGHEHRRGAVLGVLGDRPVT